MPRFRLLSAAAIAVLLPFGSAPHAQTPPAPTPATASAPIPVESFAQLPSLAQPKLSPDGKNVAAKMSIQGKQYLVVLPLFGGADAKPKILGAKESIDINWWRWVGNEWLAVGVGAQQMLYGEEYYITRTLGVKSDMSVRNQIDWNGSGLRADDVIWAARDGTPRILLSRQTGIMSMEDIYPSVIEANLSTGKIKRVTGSMSNVFDWSADAAGQLRLGFRYNDENGRSELLYRQTNAERFRSIAVSRTTEDNFVMPSIFRADGTAIGIDDNSGHDVAYEMSLPDLKLGKPVYQLAGYDIDGVIPNAAGTDIDGINVTDRYSRSVWLNPQIKDIQDAVDKAIAPRRAQIVSWNADRTRFLIEAGMPSQAGALFYFDVAAGRMQHYAWNNEALKGRSLSPVKTITYKARDGTPIEAVLTTPRGRKTEKLPVIVMPHGGPFARDSEGWDWWAQYLAESGYVVIQPNYRGSSGYGKAFAKLGEGEWGLKMQDDLNDALDWTVKEGLADPKRACMIGGSYGGYAAMRAAQRDGALYRCAVSFAGVSDLQAMQRYDSRFLYSKTRSKWLKKQAPDYKAVSPRNGAATFSIPILLVHGKEDKRVPVKQSRMLVDALKAAGKPHEYIEQPLADHFFSRAEDRLQFLKAMKAFLDKHNPA